jgi:F-type H+-transporting ATPase subunit b
MRTLSLSAALLFANAPLAFAQEHEAPAGGGGLMSIQVNLMFWTLLIFVVLYFLLSKFAFGPITKAVEAREKALEDAIEGAKRDREAAAKLLAEHQAAIEAARGEGQKMISEGRAVAEKMRADLIEQTRKEQQEMLERARREIESERDKAVAQLRREAIDLALAGASKVIEQNLESDKNRKLVENYLASIGTLEASN